MMSALQGEIEFMVAQMTGVRAISGLQREFYTGDIEGKEAVVVGSGVGKVRAAACTQYLIDRFNVRSLIVFGLAGALNTNLSVGDIVVSRETAMHDYHIAGEGVAEDIRLHPIAADQDLVALAMRAASMSGTPGHLGLVLTGDEAIADAGRRFALRQRFGGDCVDMESAAAALVCCMNDVPFVVVRGISDLADEHAHRQFETAFARVSQRSTEVVLQMVRLLPPSSGAVRRPAAGRTAGFDQDGDHRITQGY